jgi:hypothetical protein
MHKLRLQVNRALVVHTCNPRVATQETEIKRIVVQSQPGQIVGETLSQKNPSQKQLVELLKVKTLSSKLY